MDLDLWRGGWHMKKDRVSWTVYLVWSSLGFRFVYFISCMLGVGWFHLCSPLSMEIWSTFCSGLVSALEGMCIYVSASLWISYYRSHCFMGSHMTTPWMIREHPRILWDMYLRVPAYSGSSWSSTELLLEQGCLGTRNHVVQHNITVVYSVPPKRTLPFRI